MDDSALEAFREGGNYELEGIGSFVDTEKQRRTGGSSFFGSLVNAEPIIEEDSEFPNSSPDVDNSGRRS